MSKAIDPSEQNGDASEQEISENFSFVDMEYDILAFWDKYDVFRLSLQQTEGKKPFIFYDGPPFATGLPHHGHLVASTLKDVVPRYFTMQGYHVLRRFGWDCHGLPIEHEIDKKLGISAIEAVEKLGVAGYNDECRKIVQRYVTSWRKTITRIGRWVDFDNDYKTMDLNYMESVWWVFKNLWDQSLIYRDLKIVPFSTALGTGLSNFEANLNYKDVQDPAITVLFPLLDQDASLAIWTTTPWTLPSNLGVAVGEDIDYLLLQDKDSSHCFYVAEACLPALFSDEQAYFVRKSCKGADLVGLRYQPIFNDFLHLEADGAFQVIAADFVTTKAGTGLVHLAPGFGEDDFRALRASDLRIMACPVSDEGCFTEEVAAYAGMHVKDADKLIIRALKDNGYLYRQSVIQHSYPFCYRSDTPLIYKAVSSWYVRVSDFVDDLLASNEAIHWVPDHIKHGRFGNWLANASDWAISRSRVWGTPLPIWENDVTGKCVCIGSVEELHALTGVKVDDLHREFVDNLAFSLPEEEGVYRRIPDVLDCWFESGSMPYAQLHYPFENKTLFEEGFPAQYIAEGLDQTRGWFYTLTVLSTALFRKPAFYNVIVNGIVMAEDGKKMSKRLKNYTQPDILMDKWGADALRLYLLNSGLTKAEQQLFSDTGVRDMLRRVLLPWLNAFKFFNTYAAIDGWNEQHFVTEPSKNLLDRWIVSCFQQLTEHIQKEMEQYHLFAVVPRLFDFTELLTNWYIRLNRSRFWAEGLEQDKCFAYSTLYWVLKEFSKIMAPFAPFLSEHIYQNLQPFSQNESDFSSVHLCSYPAYNSQYFDAQLNEAVDVLRDAIFLGRRKRESEKVNLRTPLHHLIVIHGSSSLLSDLQLFDTYLKRELNVKSVEYCEDESAFFVYQAKPNFPVLGRRLGKRMRHFQKCFEQISEQEIADFQRTGMITIEGEAFTTEEIVIAKQAKAGYQLLDGEHISIILDCTLDDELLHEGYAREIINRIQRARKELQFKVTDKIQLCFSAHEALQPALALHQDLIARETLAERISVVQKDSDELGDEVLTFEIGGYFLIFSLKNHQQVR